MPSLPTPAEGTLWYAESGPADGRPLLLLHAALQTHESMAPLAEELAPLGLRLIAVDLPGHGRSAHAGPLTIRTMADAVAGLIERLGLDRPLAAGYSLGGIVGIELALRGLVSGLVVLASRIQPAGDARATFAPEAIRRRSPLWARQLAEKHTVTPWEALAAALGEELASWPGFDPQALAALSVPVLVVQGDRDQMVPLEQGQELARLAPQGRFCLVPRAGHPELLYRADARAAVRAFLASFLA